jgi:serine/threonine-protein kinase HipA
MPRHFEQTAAKSGIPASVVRSIFDEILESGQAAISKVLDDLPAAFPEKLTESIMGGLRSRLRLVERTGARAAP